MMMHGTPWFDSPITLDGSREYECEFNTTWQCEYQTGYWYAIQRHKQHCAE